MRKLSKNKDLTGKKFGNRLVLKRVPPPDHVKNARSYWLCKCDCGNETICEGGHLRQGTASKCVQCGNKVKRKEEGECSFNGLYLLHKHRKAAKLGFDLTKEDFRELTSSNCYYCGSPPLDNHKGRTAYGGYQYNGIDRVDTTKGYLKGNCVTCCKFCNRAKNSYSKEEFEAWINRLVKYRTNNG